MVKLYKVIKDGVSRYIKENALSAYTDAGWTLEEEMDITIEWNEDKTPTAVKSNVKVAQQGE